MPDQHRISAHIVGILRMEGGLMYCENDLELLLQLRRKGAITKKDANLQRNNPSLKNHEQLGSIWKAIEYGIEAGDLARASGHDVSSQEVILLALESTHTDEFEYTDDMSPYEDEINTLGDDVFRHTPAHHLRTAQQSLL